MYSLATILSQAESKQNISSDHIGRTIYQHLYSH